MSYPCDVTFSQDSCVPSAAITITFDMMGNDYGGSVWDLTYDDNGAGGTFDPLSGTLQIGDASSGTPSIRNVNYTAPATPQTVNFNYRGIYINDPENPDEELAFSGDGQLIVALANTGQSFLLFF